MKVRFPPIADTKCVRFPALSLDQDNDTEWAELEALSRRDRRSFGQIAEQVNPLTQREQAFSMDQSSQRQRQSARSPHEPAVARRASYETRVSYDRQQLARPNRQAG